MFPFDTVVAESGPFVEVHWDPRGGQTWHNKVVNWGACCVL